MKQITVLFLLAAAWQLVSGAPGSTTICKWKDNKTAAFSFSSDDYSLIDGEIAKYRAVCDPRGIKMTFYLITGFPGHLPNWSLWPPVIAAGHEVGSHTVTHPDNPTVTPTEAEIRAQLRDSKAAIEQNLPTNGKCISIAYSSSWYNNTIGTMATEYYIVGRGVSGVANTSSPPLPPSLGNASMMYLGVGGSIDEAIATGGWYTPYSHEMPGTFTALCDQVVSHQDVIWAGTVRDVSQYIYERDASTVQTVSATQSQIVLNLTHSLDTTVCNFTYPLTLKTEVDPSWNSAAVVQGESAAVVGITDLAGTKYAIFNARPNSGQITLSAGGSMVAAPAISPNGGTFYDSVVVTLSTATSGAAIYYTTDGAAPGTTSTLYAGPFVLTDSATVKAVGVKNEMTNSPVSSAAFMVTPTTVVATPVITPNGYIFIDSVVVTLTTATGGATIYYTTDGTDPTTASLQYTAPFTLTDNATVKAKAYRSGLPASGIAQAVFTKRGTAVNIVQAVAGGNNFGGTQTTTVFSAYNTAGNTIVVLIQWMMNSGSNSVSAVTDGRGNTYTLIPTSLANTGPTPHCGNINTQIAYATDIAAGSNSVTVTWDIGVGYGFASVLETSPGSFDQAVTGTGTSSTPSAGTITTTVNGAMGVATSFIDDGFGGGSVFTAGTGWTLFQNTGGGAADEGSEYQAQATAGPLTGNFTSSTGTWVASMATFVPSGGTTPVNRPIPVLRTAMAAPQLIGPNPIRAAAFKQYLQAHPDFRIYDLAGSPVESGSLRENSAYLIKTGDQVKWHKVMLIK